VPYNALFEKSQYRAARLFPPAVFPSEVERQPYLVIAMKFFISAALLLSAASAFAQTSQRAAARFLDQATFGPTPASVAALENSTIAAWLNAQFALNTSDLPDQPILTSTGTNNTNLAPVKSAFFQNAVSGQDQLRQRVAFALSQIWVVSQTSGVSSACAYPPYWRIFRDNAFGNYRDIIQAVTLSPAMGRYLNMANNNKASTAHNTAPNENYGRELLQLFTLGLTQLHMNGSPVLDTNSNPVPTYTEAIIPNMAKVVTGWTYPTAPGATAKTNNPEYYTGQMFAVASEHDTTSKLIFDNITIPPGGTATADLNALLDALMAQPTMAPFVSQQLIQHLVTSNPSPAYIQRVAEVFQNNGSNVAGDLKAVITAILTDPEARAGDDSNAAANPNFGHLREPVLFMANILRGLNGTLTATNSINNYTANMGEDLFNEPSVFSYFSPQYRTEKGLLGPEFQIYSTQTVADRADAVNSILYGRLDSTTTVDLTPFVSQAGSTGGLLNYVASVFLHGSMSGALTQAATSAVNAQTTPLAKAQAALYVVLTSGEYNVIQ
jgi:uncharacterized protein (DUF1800 family)